MNFRVRQLKLATLTVFSGSKLSPQIDGTEGGIRGGRDPGCFITGKHHLHTTFSEGPFPGREYSIAPLEGKERDPIAGDLAPCTGAGGSIPGTCFKLSWRCLPESKVVTRMGFKDLVPIR